MMKDPAKMSRKELEAEIRHCWNEQKEYEQEVAALKKRIESLEKHLPSAAASS